MVQEPTGQVAQARAERNECGSSRRGLQVGLWNTVHAAVRRRFTVHVVPVQQLDQGAFAAGHQALPVARQPAGIDGDEQSPPELGELLQHWGERSGGQHEQLDAPGIDGLDTDQQQCGRGRRALPVHNSRQSVHVPRRRRTLHEQQHVLEHCHIAAESQAACHRLQQPLFSAVAGVAI